MHRLSKIYLPTFKQSSYNRLSILLLCIPMIQSDSHIAHGWRVNKILADILKPCGQATNLKFTSTGFLKQIWRHTLSLLFDDQLPKPHHWKGANKIQWSDIWGKLSILFYFEEVKICMPLTFSHKLQLWCKYWTVGWS